VEHRVTFPIRPILELLCPIADVSSQIPLTEQANVNINVVTKLED
jgi:hypothetical protein